MQRQVFILKSYAEQSVENRLEWQFSFASAAATKSSDRLLTSSHRSNSCVPEFVKNRAFNGKTENVWNFIFMASCYWEFFLNSMGNLSRHRWVLSPPGEIWRRQEEKVEDYWKIFSKVDSRLFSNSCILLIWRKMWVLEEICSPSFWPSVISITIFYSYFASFTININYP